MIENTVTKLEGWRRDFSAYMDPSDLDATVAKLEAWQRAESAYLDSIKPPPKPVTGLPAHRFGAHWIPIKYRTSDVDYFRALRPPVIKIVDPSPDRVREALSAIDPNGHVALRFYPISEMHAEAAADPVGLAKAHAKYWIDQIVHGPYAEFPRNKLYVMGLNEPPISNDDEEKRQALYSEVFLTELHPHSIRCYVFNFSVGWPREINGRIIWDNFRYLEPLINATNSLGCVHEYWYPGVKNGWGSYANRISRCPMKIKFVIGECGYTRKSAGLPQPWGWDGNISAETYADQLWKFAYEVDPNKVFAVLPFTTSYGGAEWKNKDTAKAHGAILARKHSFAWPDGWPVYADVPPVEPPEDKPMNIVFPKYTNNITGAYGQLYTRKDGVVYPHEGMDLRFVTDSPIYAPANGIVAYSAIDPAYGEYIRIYCPQLKTCFFYAHLSQRLVQYGNSVKAGQKIGLTGNTGNSSAAHLHFETRAMNADGSYKVPMQGLNPDDIRTLYRRNGRVDPLGWLNGWEALGGTVEER